jgi:hypothetical protein
MGIGFAIFSILIGFVVCAGASVLLAMSGAGDHASAFQTWILAGSIILGSGVVALAIENQKR